MKVRHMHAEVIQFEEGTPAGDTTVFIKRRRHKKNIF
jgi:hypothetical protein